jgi:hypothetical protein
MFNLAEVAVNLDEVFNLLELFSLVDVFTLVVVVEGFFVMASMVLEASETSFGVRFSSSSSLQAVVINDIL